MSPFSQPSPSSREEKITNTQSQSGALQIGHQQVRLRNTDRTPAGNAGKCTSGSITCKAAAVALQMAAGAKGSCKRAPIRTFAGTSYTASATRSVPSPVHSTRRHPPSRHLRLSILHGDKHLTVPLAVHPTCQQLPNQYIGGYGPNGDSHLISTFGD